jgi:hypothetical protein
LTSSNQRPPSTYTARARRVTAAVSPRSPPRPTLPTFPPGPGSAGVNFFSQSTLLPALFPRRRAHARPCGVGIVNG